MFMFMQRRRILDVIWRIQSKLFPFLSPNRPSNAMVIQTSPIVNRPK